MTLNTLIEKKLAEFDKETHRFIAPSNCTCCVMMGAGHSMAHLRSGNLKSFLASAMREAVEEHWAGLHTTWENPNSQARDLRDFHAAFLATEKEPTILGFGVKVDKELPEGQWRLVSSKSGEHDVKTCSDSS